MIRIALCDDQKVFLEYERGIIEQYLTGLSVKYQCDEYISGGDLLSSNSIELYDLFILDYDMDGLTGFETAQKIYELFPKAKIAFATNYYDFTREGYKYNAVRYLVKQEKTFKADLAECIDYILKTESPKTILLKLGNGLTEVSIDDIVYIGSDKHYIEYFVKDLDDTFYIRRCSLDDALVELPEQFIRVHQRFIVNLKNAIQINRYEIVVKKSAKVTKKLPVARNRFEDVVRKFCLLKGQIG